MSSASSSASSSSMTAPLSSPSMHAAASRSYFAVADTQAPTASSTDAVPGTSNAAAPFLRDFNLVAEAAKRAQMAVLMRDLEGVAL